MTNLKQRIGVLGVLALLALSATSTSAQTSPPIELPKIDEPSMIRIAYNRQGQGKISAANREGRVNQFMEVWEDKSKIPNVVTYVFVSEDRQTYVTATWGKGPVNREAFLCPTTPIPEFDEKSLWVATVKDSLLTFQQIEDKDINDMFSNLTRTRRDWDAEVNATNPKRNANTTQNNILSFLKKKNREKWLQNGWLQPATACVRHF